MTEVPPQVQEQAIAALREILVKTGATPEVAGQFSQMMMDRVISERLQGRTPGDPAFNTSLPPQLEAMLGKAATPDERLAAQLSKWNSQTYLHEARGEHGKWVAGSVGHVEALDRKAGELSDKHPQAAHALDRASTAMGDRRYHAAAGHIGNAAFLVHADGGSAEDEKSVRDLAGGLSELKDGEHAGAAPFSYGNLNSSPGSLAPREAGVAANQGLSEMGLNTRDYDPYGQKRPLAMSADERNAAGIRDSRDLHKGPDGELTPQRKALHRKIVEETLAGQQPSDHPVAEFLGGGPASGKSSLGTEHAGALVDVDALKAKLPEYQELMARGDESAAAFTHEESSDIAGEVRKEAIRRHLSYTLDGTGDTGPAKMRRKLAEAKSAGYTTRARYVTVDTDEAVRRANARGKETGRYVPEAVIRAQHAAVTKTFTDLASHDSPDEMELWDTNGVAPGHGRLIAVKQPGGNFEVKDPASYSRFEKKADEAVTKSEKMERGEAAGRILLAVANHRSFEEAGVPEEHRDLFDQTVAEHSAAPPGHVTDIPWDYAADE